MKRNPFVTGRWVQGPQYFGRKELLHRLSTSREACEWVIGMRRMGKTSLLRELERRFHESGKPAFPLFWDVQGSYDEDGLRESLLDALEDSNDTYADKWELMSIPSPTKAPCHQVIKSLCRHLHSHGVEVYLLVDESEEFLNIAKNDAETLVRLRKCMQSTQNLHTILCSTPRLESLYKEQSSETSPFLHGFNVQFLGSLADDESLTLINQGEFDGLTAEEILLLAEGNPYQLQLLGKMQIEMGDLHKVVLELETNPALQQVIEVNFDLLTTSDQDLIRDVMAGKTQLQAYQPYEQSSLLKLEKLGFLHCFESQNFSIRSHFFRKWLQRKTEQNPSIHTVHVEDLALNDWQLALSQLMSLYQIFVEFRQKGVALDGQLTEFFISSVDRKIYPKQPVLQEVSNQTEFWHGAISDLKCLLHYKIPNSQSWTLSRFFELAEKPDLRTENEFIDLIALIEAEAQL